MSRKQGITLQPPSPTISPERTPHRRKSIQISVEEMFVKEDVKTPEPPTRKEGFGSVIENASRRLTTNRRGRPKEMVLGNPKTSTKGNAIRRVSRAKTRANPKADSDWIPDVEVQPNATRPKVKHTRRNTRKENAANSEQILDARDISPESKEANSISRKEKNIATLNFTPTNTSLKREKEPSVTISEDKLKEEQCYQHLYPDMIECTDNIDGFFSFLTSLASGKLVTILQRRGIQTVGQLCRLSMADVEDLPIRQPKVRTLIDIIKDYIKFRSSVNKEDPEVVFDGIHAQMRKVPEVVDIDTPLGSATSDTWETIGKYISENPSQIETLIEKLDTSVMERLFDSLLNKLSYLHVTERYYVYLRNKQQN